MDARPYVQPGCEDIFDCMKTIASFDVAAAEKAAEIIEELEGIPQVDPYTENVAEMNYLDVRFCSERLLQKLKDEYGFYDSNLRMFEYGKPPYAFISETLEGLGRLIAVLDTVMTKAGLISTAEA
jgi:hypothetical protein